MFREKNRGYFEALRKGRIALGGRGKILRNSIVASKKVLGSVSRMVLFGVQDSLLSWFCSEVDLRFDLTLLERKFLIQIYLEANDDILLIIEANPEHRSQHLYKVEKIH